MGTFIFILLVLFLICCIIAFFAGAIEFLFVTMVTAALGLGAPYVSLNTDVHRILTEQQYIEMEQQYIAGLREQLENIPDKPQALMNADSPVATMTIALHDAQKTLRSRQITILDAKRSIQQRRAGLTSYIFWFYNGELLEQVEDK